LIIIISLINYCKLLFISIIGYGKLSAIAGSGLFCCYQKLIVENNQE